MYLSIPTLEQWKKDSSPRSPKAAGLMALIDRDLKLLEGRKVKSLTNMSQRNLLIDVKRSVDELASNKGKYGWNFAVGSLKAIIDKELASATVSANTYNRVMCVGWAIQVEQTVGAGNYFKYSGRDRDDMLAKCKEMYLAIRVAATAVAMEDPLAAADPKVLKVFMAPEFYFRGAHGAYAPEVVAEIVPNLRHLGTDKMTDWLFVFGTAISAHNDTVSVCNDCGNLKITWVPDPTRPGKTKGRCPVDAKHTVGEGSYGAEIHNVALIQQGAESHLVAKEFISGIDFNVDHNDRPFVMIPRSANSPRKKMFAIAAAGSSSSRLKPKHDDERLGGCIFTFDGLTIGLEVCLDHEASHHNPAGTGRLAPYADIIQLHLIPSAGMSIGTGLYCRPGGIVFNVDGLSGGTSDLVIKGDPVHKTASPYGGANLRGSIDCYGPYAIPGR